VTSPSELEGAFETMTREGAGAVFVVGGTMLFANRARLAEHALKRRLPMMYAPARSSRWLGGLQPAVRGGLVVQVLGTESSFQVLLFSRYDDVVDERHGCNERGQQPQAVDPDRNSEW
jgi:hypothetical protein